MEPQIELINEETLGISFPYQPDLVASLKRLNNRRWNPKKCRWEVHLSHLPEVIKIFSLSPKDLGAPIVDRWRQGWSRGGLKVILGPAMGRLAGGGAPLTEIDDRLSFFLPGHQYSPKFIAKKWDGKRHLFDRRKQSFPSGLWSYVREILDSEGVTYEVETVEPPVTGAPALATGPVRARLRPYQREALERALKAGRGIVQMATGGGKTLLAAHVIRKVGRPTFFVVHTLDLLYQTAEVFAKELGIEVGLLGDGQADLKPLTVATVQTVARAFQKGRLPEEEPEAEEDDEEEGRSEKNLIWTEQTRQRVRQAIEAAELVIFDECHHVPASTFYKIAMATGSARWRLGLSATPWRDDQCDLLLEAALGPKVHATTCSDLIEGGFLVPPRIHMIGVAAPRGLSRRGGYPECYQRAIVENQERNRVIATRAHAMAAAGRSVLVLVAHVAHGQALQELLPEASFAYGALDSAVRRKYLKELERKLRPVMIATTLADEGLDVPSLGGVILAGGGKSQTKAYQRIGRALRPAPGKTEAEVVDFYDEAPFLRQHSEARLALYRQEKRFAIHMER